MAHKHDVCECGLRKKAVSERCIKCLRTPKDKCGTDSGYRAGCRCELCASAHADANRRQYTREKGRRRRAKHRDKNARYMREFRLRSYGLTSESFELMLSSQGGACAICRHVFTHQRPDFACVDHCHKTGAVRGLLCVACNNGIGRFRDRPDVLVAAARYVRERGTDVARGIGATTPVQLVATAVDSIP